MNTGNRTLLINAFTQLEYHHEAQGALESGFTQLLNSSVSLKKHTSLHPKCLSKESKIVITHIISEKVKTLGNLFVLF